MTDYGGSGIMLHAAHVDNCPVFNPGDIILAQGRKALNIHNNTCAFQYSQIRKILEAMEKNLNIKELGMDLRDETFRCKDYDCEGRFRIDIVTPSEIRALQRARLVAEEDPLVADLQPSVTENKNAEIAAASPIASSDETVRIAPSAVTFPSQPGKLHAGSPYLRETELMPKSTAAEIIPSQISKPITVVVALPTAVRKASAFASSNPERVAKSTTGFINRVTGEGTTAVDELPFLHNLPRKMVRLLFAAGEQLEFAVGESIIQQGQAGTHLYIIETGSTVVVKQMPEGHEVELATLGSGQCVGEMSLLSGEECNASVVATEACNVLAVPMVALENLMTTNPPLHRAFSSVFMARLKATNIKLEEELVRGMTGKLSMISLLEIMQTLLMSKQTGTLSVTRQTASGGERGLMYLLEGQVRYVQYHNLHGEDAFYSLGHWTDGSFAFMQRERDDLEVNIHRGTMQIMMDAARMMDENSVTL